MLYLLECLRSLIFNISLTKILYLITNTTNILLINEMIKLVDKRNWKVTHPHRKKIIIDRKKKTCITYTTNRLSYKVISLLPNQKG